MKKPPVDLTKYIGRDYAELNCLDLVKLFYKDIFNLELKNYFEGPIPDREEAQSLIVSNKGDFAQVLGKPQFGDIVVVRLYGFECHLGVVVTDKTFLHSVEKTGSSIERLHKYYRVIAGFYRHRERVESDQA